MSVSEERKLLNMLLDQGGETAVKVLAEAAEDNPVASELIRERFLGKLGPEASLRELIEAVEQDPLREALLERPLHWFLPAPAAGSLLGGEPDGPRQRSSSATIERVKLTIVAFLDSRPDERFRKSQIIEELGLERARVETALKQLKVQDKLATFGERATMVYFSRSAR